MTLKQEFAAVVDIGSSKITALAGELNENGRIEIIGQATAEPRGIKRGIVLNPEEFAGAIRSLINDLENQCGAKIKVVDVSLAGQGITAVSFEGIRYIETGLVSQADVDYLRNEASNMPLEPGLRIYHLFPVDYEIGEETNVTVPVGHEGRKMKARYSLIVAPSSYQDSVEKALTRAGLQLGRFVLSPLALSEAVITEEEKDLGVVLVDLGCGTTKIISYAEGKLTNLAVIPFAGDAITHDIREGCSMIHKWAEQLKVQYGQAMGDFADEDKVVTIPGHNGWEAKEISFKSLAFIIQARLEEIIDSIYFQIEKSGFKTQTAQGIILTGGTSKLPNLLQLVKFRTGMDARLGFSQVRLASSADIDKTRFLNALGLLQMSLKDSMPARPSKPRKTRVSNEGNNNGFFSTLGKKMTQQLGLLFEDDDAKM